MSQGRIIHAVWWPLVAKIRNYISPLKWWLRNSAKILVSWKRIKLWTCWMKISLSCSLSLYLRYLVTSSWLVYFNALTYCATRWQDCEIKIAGSLVLALSSRHWSQREREVLLRTTRKVCAGSNGVQCAHASVIIGTSERGAWLGSPRLQKQARSVAGDAPLEALGVFAHCQTSRLELPAVRSSPAQGHSIRTTFCVVTWL